MKVIRDPLARLDAWLTRWVMGRNFSAALLGGGLAFAAATAIFSGGMNTMFQLRQNRADALRWGATEANVQFLRLRAADAEFLGSSGGAVPGTHTTQVAAIIQQLRELQELAGAEQSAQLRRIEAEVGRYDAAFRASASDAGPLSEVDAPVRRIDPLFEQVIATATAASAAAKQAVMIATVAVAAIALVIAALFLRTFARALAVPIQRLGRSAATIGQGNLATRIEIEVNNELAALARSFNEMVDQLATLVDDVRKSGIQVASSTNEIAATARQQQATAGEVAATTMEIGATSREISATSQQLSRTIAEVAEAAARSATLAGGGQTQLSQMEQTMRQIVDAAGAINARLNVLSISAGNIGKVVTTIMKVAEQTNLLSLNAAIEAEKAGEYGRGFAVVATEIRRLADQTAIATYDIEQMVKQIQSAVTAGVMEMDKFSGEVRHGMEDVQQVSGQLSQVITHVQALAPRFEVVNEGMAAQATGAEQITQGLAQLTETAQQTVESLRQSAQAIDGLSTVSTALRNSVARFKLQGAPPAQ